LGFLKTERIIPANSVKDKNSRHSVKSTEESNSESLCEISEKSTNKGEQNKKKIIPIVYFANFKGKICAKIIFLDLGGDGLYVS
jgi:hypothetical protein